MTSIFAPSMFINTARQKKTSTHQDGNITGNQQISSHYNIATVHYDKLQNINTILEDQRNKDYIRKLWLSI